jgi:hypothetical protein
MKVMCAWCKSEIGTESGSDTVRYSVCKKCLAKFRIFPEDSEKENSPAGTPETEAVQG